MAQPAHQHGKLGLSNSTKIAIGIIVLVGIAAFLFYDPAGLNIGLEDDGKTDIFGNKIGGRVDFTIKLSELPQNNFILKDANIVLSKVQPGDIILDTVVIGKDKNLEASFEAFNGKLNLEGGDMSVEGTAATATINGVDLKPKTKKFMVSVKSRPDSYVIDHVTIDRINLVKVYGNIERIGAEKSTIDLTNSTVEIDGFEGKMSFDGKSYILSGSANEIRGKSFVLKGE
jgi:hypothetical protein